MSVYRQARMALGTISKLPSASNRRALHSSTNMQMNKDWNANQYLKFHDERTRPSRELLNRVPLTSPQRIVDLGCGPGNSTAVLADQYSNADISGMDSSPDMIEKAKKAHPQLHFWLDSLDTYKPDAPVDLFFSNAVFQWLPSETRLPIIARLMQSQKPGGVFAFQVPDNLSEPSHALMAEVAAAGPWAESLSNTSLRRKDIESPREIYDSLRPYCSDIDIWHTHYQHIMDNHQGIIEWLKSTGLRPFLDPLSPDETTQFLDEYLRRLKDAYPATCDGKVLFKFPRLFVVAVRK